MAKEAGKIIILCWWRIFALVMVGRVPLGMFDSMLKAGLNTDMTTAQSIIGEKELGDQFDTSKFLSG